MMYKHYKSILASIAYPISIWEIGLTPDQTECKWANSQFDLFIYKEYQNVNSIHFILPYITFEEIKEIMKDLKGEKQIDIKTHKITIRPMDEKYFYMFIEVQHTIKDDYNFLSNISHEIRTPLNGIIGITSLLADTLLTDEQINYVEILKQSGYNLMAIINDILDATKLELNKISLNDASFYLRDCVESSFDIISSMVSKKNIECTFKIYQDTPDYIVGDYQRLRQILVNLLSNAIKFTKKGSVKLQVQLFETRANEMYEIQFKVIDTGIGIAAKDMQKLFKAFTQIDQTTTKEFEGTGLGLVISKQLCELMGGKIWCESVPNEGSTFYFTIKAKGFFGRADDSSDFFDKNLIKGKKVLILDDKEENRTYLQITIYKLGMKPFLFASAEEALTHIKHSKISFDIGLIDICMPRMDGNQFALQLKNMKQKIPLIALSSLGDREIDSNLFHAYLLKPIHEEKLLKLLFNQLSSGQKEEKDEEKTTSESDVCRNISILVAEDIYLNQQVIVGILKKLGYKNTDIVENGHEVLNVLKKKKYDLILMDIKMPLLDGITASKKISKLYGKDRPKIIVVTAVAMKGDRESHTSSGKIDGYLIKPIDIKTLQAEIERIFCS